MLLRFADSEAVCQLYFVLLDDSCLDMTLMDLIVLDTYDIPLTVHVGSKYLWLARLWHTWAYQGMALHWSVTCILLFKVVSHYTLIIFT